MYCTTAIIQSRVEAADTAVRLNARDPESHYTRALTLVNFDRLDEAVAELHEAIRLRPYHYYEWLDLGVTLDRLGDEKGALDALEQSIRLAPNFAQPHWQLGNIYFRQQRYDEAFDELRRGAQEYPNLIEELINLAWTAADGDIARMESLIKVKNQTEQLKLARLLERHGDTSGALSGVRKAGRPSEQEARDVLHEIVTDLMKARQFAEAYEVWALSQPENSISRPGELLNGDFSYPILNDSGFGWQTRSVPNVTASIDPAGPAVGARSLRIEYGGDSEPAEPVLGQLMLVKPGTNYSLGFLARSENLVTGGRPVIAVVDVTGEERKVLGYSKPIASVASDWTPYSAEFTTSKATSAVVISVKREPCAQTPCPIFGRLWLSRFWLTSH